MLTPSSTPAAPPPLDKQSDLASNVAGVFDGHLAPGTRPCLLIIDMVQAYLQPDSPIYAGIEDALASTTRLLHLARRLGVPVIHTNVECVPGGAERRRFLPQKRPSSAIFEKGSPMGAFHSASTTRGGGDIAVRQRVFWHVLGFHPYGLTAPRASTLSTGQKVRKGVVVGRVLGWRTPGGAFSL